MIFEGKSRIFYNKFKKEPDIDTILILIGCGSIFLLFGMSSFLWSDPYNYFAISFGLFLLNEALFFNRLNNKTYYIIATILILFQVITLIYTYFLIYPNIQNVELWALIWYLSFPTASIIIVIYLFYNSVSHSNYKKARKLYDQNNYPEALKYFNKILEKNPDYAEALIGKGVTLSMLGKLDEALECQEKALKLKPDNIYGLNNKCNILIKLEKFEEAENCLDDLLDSYPNDVTAWMNLSMLLIEMERYEEAIECLENVLILDPDYENACFYKGFCLGELEKYKEALEAYNKVLKLDSKDLEAWGNKGIILNKLEKHEEALKCFNKVLNLNSENLKGWYNKGNSLKNLKRYNEALKCYEKALEMDSNYKPALEGKKEVLKLMGK